MRTARSHQNYLRRLYERRRAIEANKKNLMLLMPEDKRQDFQIRTCQQGLRRSEEGHDHYGQLSLLRVEGCNVDAKVEESEYGKFGWVMDPEGNRVELWEPPPGR